MPSFTRIRGNARPGTPRGRGEKRGACVLRFNFGVEIALHSQIWRRIVHIWYIIYKCTLYDICILSNISNINSYISIQLQYIKYMLLTLPQGYWNTANYAKRDSAAWHDSCWPFWGKFFPPAMMWLGPWKQVCDLLCFHLHRLQWFVSISKKLGQISCMYEVSGGCFLLEVLGRMMMMMMMMMMLIIIILILSSYY